MVITQFAFAEGGIEQVTRKRPREQSASSSNGSLTASGPSSASYYATGDNTGNETEEEKMSIQAKSNGQAMC